MSSYVHVNPNPKNKNVGDCVVRAISIAADMDCNDVWISYLASKGWSYHRLQDSCPFCYTIDDFAREHNNGTYIVATGSHVVCVKDGSYLDAWDSGEKTCLFYFEKEK